MRTISQKILIVFLLLSTVLTIGAAPAANPPHKTFFTGTETAGPVIDMGTWTLRDGKFIVRGMIQLGTDATTDERISGDVTVTVNGIFDAATMSGPMEGTAQTINDGGVWTGHWVGKLEATGLAKIYVHYQGQGGYHGMTASIEYTRLSPGPMAPYAISGYIVDAP